MLTTTTRLDRLHAALRDGNLPDDLITPLRDLLHQLDFATGAATALPSTSPDDLVQRSAYRANTLDWCSTRSPGSRALCR